MSTNRVHSSLLSLTLVAFALVATGCYTRHHHGDVAVGVGVGADVPYDYDDVPEPPAVQAEVAVTSPGPGYTWVPGYWDWNGTSYAWTAGAWVQAPYPDAVWVAPSWNGHHGGRGGFRRGYWRHH